MGNAERSILLLFLCPWACSDREVREGEIELVYSGSAVGTEGEVLREHLDRFTALHPGIRVRTQAMPDSADHRHQLYVQWLGARAPEPDVLQLDVIWTPEFAAAGWLLPLDPYGPDAGAFFPQAVEANRFGGHLDALPLFVDAGMLYWRTDLIDRPPETLEELAASAKSLKETHHLDYGFVWQGARYEGLVTVFLEHLSGFGGRILDETGRAALRSDRALWALDFMRATAEPSALAWHEEEARFAFQNGKAAFMRNWPYAFPLMNDPRDSKIAGRFAVAPMPRAEGGRRAATLGGAQLAINAYSRHPDAAFALIEFLTQPEQEKTRAARCGQYPPRPALYGSGALDGLVPIRPADALQIIDSAVPRPATPRYSELSAALQIEVHAALTGQKTSKAALDAASSEIDAILESHPPESSPLAFAVLAAIAALVLVASARRRSRLPKPAGPARGPHPGEVRLAWSLTAPTLLVIGLVVLFPVGWTAWESVHARDLRAPWLGRPFVGGANYLEAFFTPRFWSALGHTAFFTAVSVFFELLLGLALALVLHRAIRFRGAVRAVSLIPWAIPTVVGALVWQFMFADAGLVNAWLGEQHRWFADPILAWVPPILADAWKTSPFVGLLLLAGLQTIDDELYEAARTDGATAWQQLIHITLPMLRPTIAVALIFRTMDAFRVFDLIYVLTGGGPGTATEPIVLYACASLLQHLRFGYGSALAMIIFAISFGLSMLYVRWMEART